MRDGFDVKALRAFRVLRPLRLVSGVPSKYVHHVALLCSQVCKKLTAWELRIQQAQLQCEC